MVGFSLPQSFQDSFSSVHLFFSFFPSFKIFCKKIKSIILQRADFQVYLTFKPIPSRTLRLSAFFCQRYVFWRTLTWWDQKPPSNFDAKTTPNICLSSPSQVLPTCSDPELQWQLANKSDLVIYPAQHRASRWTFPDLTSNCYIKYHTCTFLRSWWAIRRTLTTSSNNNPGWQYILFQG